VLRLVSESILIKDNKMATKANEMTCSAKSCSPCPCGWLGKRVLGLSLGVWLLLFAVLPMSARGVSWSARTVAGLWDGGARVVERGDGPMRADRPARRERDEN
tara:strand:+ start:506 stop:814 length:309 start_codon:yes stop_codon:yes gene_type:complete